jgi:hypothetical protein
MASDTEERQDLPLSAVTTLLSTDQFHIATQRFWPQLKRLVTEQSWTEVAALQGLGEYLSNHCMICGMWQNRFQELHGHYRLHHAELIQGSIYLSKHIYKAEIIAQQPNTPACISIYSP